VRLWGAYVLETTQAVDGVQPKADTKSIEVTRGITQIIYQSAIAAKVALGL